jgi:replicative DNA helicase
MIARNGHPPKTQTPAARLAERVNNAERAVLGSMLRHHDCIAEVVLAVGREDFHCDAHQRVWDAVLAVWNAGGGADLVTVAEALAAGGWVQDAGGYAHLAELSEAEPTGAWALRHARIVRGHGLRRRLGCLAAEIVRECDDAAG